MLSPTFPIPSVVPGGSSEVEDCHEVTNWLTGRLPTAIYLYGEPGIGKSAFSGILLRRLRKLNLESVPVAYFSFSDQDERRTSSTALISSLIYQILSQDPQRFGLIRDLYLAIKDRSIWGFQPLWILFRSLLATPGLGLVYCIIDNIHSYDFLARSRFLSHLTDLLQDGSVSKSLKIILIGGLQQDIGDSVKTYHKIQLDHMSFLEILTRGRAEQFITELIEEKPFLLEFRPDLEENLYYCGDFLQLSVTLDLWTEHKQTLFSSWKVIRSNLEALPYDISNEVTLRVRKLPEWAGKALDWIFHTQRPLEIKELAAVIALVEDKKSIKLDEDRLLLDPSTDVKQVFGPLLKVVDNEVYWSHEQIKECYNKAIAHSQQITDSIETESSVQHGVQYLDHWSITRFLLKYLCSQDFTIPMKRALDGDTWIQPQGPLFDMMAYAVQFWPAHYRKATENKSKAQGSYYAEAMLEYLKNEDLIRLWWRLKFRLSRIDFPSSACVKWPLLLAAHLGFADVVDVCKTQMPEGDTFTMYDHFTIRGTAIAYASRMGHLEIVTKLCDERFEMETADNTHYLTRALIQASHRGHEEIVDFLMDYIPRPTVDFVWDPVLLCQAAEIGYETLVKKFTTAGAGVDVAHKGTTPLQFAAKNGHESIVKHLLSLGADVNSEAAKDSFKPIMHAVNKGYTTMIQLLIEYGAGVRQLNANGQTVLHLAAQHGRQEITRLLLERIPDLAARDRMGRTALHLASLNGHAEVVETLAPNSSVDTWDGDGDTPLRLASKSGHMSAVKVLLQSGARVDLTGIDHHTALYSAAINGHEAIAQMMLQQANAVKLNFADIVDVFQEAAKRGFLNICKLCLPIVNDEMVDGGYKEQRTALHHAARDGRDEIVKLLLDRGTDIECENDEGNTPLVVAAIAGRFQVVQILLARKANPFRKNSKRQTLVSQLANLPHKDFADGHIDTVRALLKAGVSVDTVDNLHMSALHHAINMNNLKIAQELLSSSADPMLPDATLWTPLHWAARNDKEFSELLLKYNTDPQICDAFGWTPFHVALKHGNVDVMEVLWKATPSVIRQSGNSGGTPLHFVKDRTESTEWLLAHEVEVDAKDEFGQTPLMTAAQLGSGDVVGLLLSHHAAPQVRDNSGKTALYFAAEVGSVSVAQRLLEKDVSIINYLDGKQRSALHIAIQREHFDCARILLLQQPHIDIDLQDQNGNTPLLLAVSAGHRMQGFVQLLIRAGPDTELRNKVGQNALSTAVRDGKGNLWKLLLDMPNGCKINAGGGVYPTALHVAAEEGEMHTVEQLVNRGANVNAKGGLFHTALQAAAADGFDDIVEYLLEEGADASLTGGLFGNALSAAVYSGTFDIVPKLNDRGAAIDIKDGQGRTALHLAAWRGSWDMIVWLKNKGSDLNVKDHQGRTILHHAAMGGNPDVVRRFLNNKDTRHLNVEDVDGWTPLHWACRSEANTEVVLLLKHGTDFRQPTHDQWTPENISIFHDAEGLLPIMRPTLADTNQSHTTDGQGANRASAQAKKWNTGLDHWGDQCDGCGQKVSQSLSWCHLPPPFLFFKAMF